MNTAKIKGKMRENGVTYKDIASSQVWDCAVPTVSLKINGKRPIYLDEANALANLLHLTTDEYYQYFFASKIA